MGGGVEVFVSGGRLMVRLRTPLPPLYRGVPLHPDDETDPYVFRMELSQFGMGTARVVFSHDDGIGTTAVHVDLGGQPLSLVRRPATWRPRTWLTGAFGALAVATTARAVRRRSARHKAGQA